jgi:hypothetical protein
MGQNSAVGIATRYELDGRGIESRKGKGFLYPSSLALRSTKLPVQWVLALFPGDKTTGA